MSAQPVAQQFEPFVPAQAVATFLSVTKREVMRLTRAGRIPAHPVDASAERKIWRYRLSEIIASMEANYIDKSATFREDDAVLGSPEKARKRKN